MLRIINLNVSAGKINSYIYVNWKCVIFTENGNFDQNVPKL